MFQPIFIKSPSLYRQKNKSCVTGISSQTITPQNRTRLTQFKNSDPDLVSVMAELMKMRSPQNAGITRDRNLLINRSRCESSSSSRSSSYQKRQSIVQLRLQDQERKERELLRIVESARSLTKTNLVREITFSNEENKLLKAAQKMELDGNNIEL